MTTAKHAELLHAVEFGTIPEKLAAAEELATHAQRQYDTLATIPHTKDDFQKLALKTLKDTIDLWEREARTLRTLLTVH